MSQVLKGEVGRAESVAEDVPQTVTEPGALLQRWPAPAQDPTQAQFMRLQEASRGLVFWNDAAEDIYSLNDGEPL